ncbi:hypothetical protein ScPMuIL_008179 [Solemya velum]
MDDQGEMESKSPGSVKKNIQIKLSGKNTARRGRPRKGAKAEPAKTDNVEEPKPDEDIIDATIFKVIGPGEPIHQKQHLKWDHKVNLLGEKVVDPLIHCCEKCTLPILIYGRMIPCKHVFCSDCAKKTEKSCPRCEEQVLRIEQSALGTVFVCNYGGSKHSVDGCRRTYLSQRDLKAHIDHRHLKVSPAAEQKTQSRTAAGSKENYASSSSSVVSTKSQSQSSAAVSNPIIETYSTASGRQTGVATGTVHRLRPDAHQMPGKQPDAVHQTARPAADDPVYPRGRDESHASTLLRQHMPQPTVHGQMQQQGHILSQPQVLGLTQQAGKPMPQPTQQPLVQVSQPQPMQQQQALGQLPPVSQPHNLATGIPQSQPPTLQQHMMGQVPVSSHGNYQMQASMAPMASRTNLITVQIQDDQSYTAYQACPHPGMPPTTFNTSVPPPNQQQFPNLRQLPPVTYSTPPPMVPGGSLYRHAMIQQPPPSVPNPHSVPQVSHPPPQGAPLSMPGAPLSMTTAPPVSMHGHPGGPLPQMGMPGGPVPQQHHPGAPPQPRFPTPRYDETPGGPSYSPGQSPRMQWSGPPPNRGPPPGGAQMHPPPQRPQSDYNQYF